MDTARQVLRWAIPGWNLWLFALLFITLRFIVSGRTLTLTDFASMNFAQVLSLLTALAGLGIPVGYLIYQIYFWIYWSIPFPIKNPEDRGYSILKDCNVDWKALVGYELDREAHRSAGKEIIRIGKFKVYVKTRGLLKRYQHNWLLAEFAWERALWLNDAEWLDRRAIILSDVYHSLGASLLSLWLGYGIYLVYDVVMHRSYIMAGDRGYLVAIGFNLIPLVLFSIILRFNRTDTLRSLEALKHDFITYFGQHTETFDRKIPQRRRQVPMRSGEELPESQWLGRRDQ